MKAMNPLARVIFASRWLQLPLYLGLIVAQGVYAYRFLLEVFHLVMGAPAFTEAEIMMMVLSLIDIVMISNLLIMVIIGGYETFVSRLNVEGHKDEPEWLGHVSTGTLKIKLALSLISISSIHLLKTFIDAVNHTDRVIVAQASIHMVFVISACAFAWIDRMTASTKH